MGEPNFTASTIAMRPLPLLCFFALLFFACRKDNFVNNVTIEEPPPIVLVVSSFKGKVVDVHGQPVPGARVTVFNQTATTDAKGRFEFLQVESPKGAALVQAEKNGYYAGSTMSGNSADGQQYIQVVLLERAPAQYLQAANGATLYWNGGMRIQIKPNALHRANGALYSGQVAVSARWLDPTDPQLGALMPGALMARDENGNERVLATYGMTFLELKTPAGEDLFAQASEPVEIAMPIPQELAGKAPTEIPLWYFDLEQERWLYNGLCQKSGGNYLCKVTKGGFWNCDVPLEAICLSGTVFQSDSTPALYTKVIVEDLTDNFIYWGYTDRNGFFCGSVPKGALLKITIKDLCDNILYEANIGPFAADTDLGEIYLPQTLQQYLVHISGTLHDCQGMPVTEGQVAVQYPGKTRLFPLTAPGVFAFALALNCTDFPEMQITGYDLAAFKATPVQFHYDDTPLDLGVLVACQDPDDYLRITADGTLYQAAPTQFYRKNNVSTNWMVLEANTTGGTFRIELRQYTGIGQYTANAFLYLIDRPDAPLYPVLQAASPDVVVTVTTDNGQFIEGTLTGTAFDTFQAPHPVSGNFRIKKQF